MERKRDGLFSGLIFDVDILLSGIGRVGLQPLSIPLRHAAFVGPWRLC